MEEQNLPTKIFFFTMCVLSIMVLLDHFRFSSIIPLFVLVVFSLALGKILWEDNKDKISQERTDQVKEYIKTKYEKIQKYIKKYKGEKK